MAYVDQYEDARMKIHETRKCIPRPENIIVNIYIYIEYKNYTNLLLKKQKLN